MLRLLCVIVVVSTLCAAHVVALHNLDETDSEAQSEWVSLGQSSRGAIGHNSGRTAFRPLACPFGYWQYNKGGVTLTQCEPQWLLRVHKKAATLCLNGAVASGALVTLVPCVEWTNTYQLWFFSTGTTGCQQLQVYGRDNMCLTWSSQTNTQTSLRLQPCSCATGQTWTIKSLGGGYGLTPNGGGQCIDMWNSMLTGDNAGTYDCASILNTNRDFLNLDKSCTGSCAALSRFACLNSGEPCGGCQNSTTTGGPLISQGSSQGANVSSNALCCNYDCATLGRVPCATSRSNCQGCLPNAYASSSTPNNDTPCTVCQGNLNCATLGRLQCTKEGEPCDACTTGVGAPTGSSLCCATDCVNLNRQMCFAAGGTCGACLPNYYSPDSTSACTYALCDVAGNDCALVNRQPCRVSGACFDCVTGTFSPDASPSNSQCCAVDCVARNRYQCVQNQNVGAAPNCGTCLAGYESGGGTNSQCTLVTCSGGAGATPALQCSPLGRQPCTTSGPCGACFSGLVGAAAPSNGLCCAADCAALNRGACSVGGGNCAACLPGFPNSPGTANSQCSPPGCTVPGGQCSTVGRVQCVQDGACGACTTGVGPAAPSDVRCCAADCTALGRQLCAGVNGNCGACASGFTGVSNGPCTDINECILNNGDCGVGYACTNTPGSRTCADVNECANSPCASPPQAECFNQPATYRCVCDLAAGFTGNGVTCTQAQAAVNAATVALDLFVPSATIDTPSELDEFRALLHAYLSLLLGIPQDRVTVSGATVTVTGMAATGCPAQAPWNVAGPFSKLRVSLAIVTSSSSSGGGGGAYAAPTLATVSQIINKYATNCTGLQRILGVRTGDPPPFAVATSNITAQDQPVPMTLCNGHYQTDCAAGGGAGGGGSSPAGAIAGAFVAVLVVGGLVFLLCWMRKRKRGPFAEKSKSGEPGAYEMRVDMEGGEGGTALSPNDTGYAAHSTPPTTAATLASKEKEKAEKAERAAKAERDKADKAAEKAEKAAEKAERDRTAKAAADKEKAAEQEQKAAAAKEKAAQKEKEQKEKEAKAKVAAPSPRAASPSTAAASGSSKGASPSPRAASASTAASASASASAASTPTGKGGKVGLAAVAAASSDEQTLRDVLESPERTKPFSDFVRSEYSSENLDFYLAVEEYRGKRKKLDRSALPAVQIAKALEKDSQELYQKFLSPELASSSINIPDEVMIRLVQNLKTFSSTGKMNLVQQTDDGVGYPVSSTRTVFDEAQEVVFKLMESDSFRRFQRSVRQHK